MGRPKALVEGWLGHAVDALDEGGCDRVVVVLGAEAGRAVALLGDRDVDVVLAPDWEEGMGASLRAGLSALEATGQEDAALVSLVDLPDVGADVVRRVLGTRAGEYALARASYAGTPGHPVLLGRAHWAGVLETATGDQGARAYLSTRAVELVECGDLASGHDVDS